MPYSLVLPCGCCCVLFVVVTLLPLLADNDLMGTIPFEISWLSDLRELNLNRVYLHGTIPNQIGSKLSNLRLIQLYSNELTGTIPPWIIGPPSSSSSSSTNSGSSSSTTSGGGANGDEVVVTALPMEEEYVLTNLEVVLLGENYFTGTIPNSRTISKVMTRLQFGGENFLTGTIPEELFDIKEEETNIYAVSFSNNMLSGPIPTTVGKLSDSLRILDFNVNMLSGSIPSEIGLLTELRDLYLRDNELR